MIGQIKKVSGITKWKQELKEGEYLILHALAIKPEMHQKGIASKIIKFSIDTARAENFKAIRIDVVPSNIPAKKLFQKNGFNYIGDIDLELGIGNIPQFSMFEFNI